MFTNPLTSFFGFAILLCPVIEAIFPDMAGSCGHIKDGLIGGGLVTAADGMKNPLFKKTA